MGLCGRLHGVHHLGQVDDSSDFLSFHGERLQDPGTGQDLPSDHLSTGSRHGLVIYRLNCHDRQVPLGTKRCASCLCDVDPTGLGSIASLSWEVALGWPSSYPHSTRLAFLPPEDLRPTKISSHNSAAQVLPTRALPQARQAPLWLPRRHNRNPAAASVHTGQDCTPSTLESQG